MGRQHRASGRCELSTDTQTLAFSGDVLQRGFWLYVWEITTPCGENVYCVGRTGDSSSPNAQSPFNRMGQHLGFNKKNNVLRHHLEAVGIVPEQCKFHLVAHGPILPEAVSPDEHARSRDIIAALEKALADNFGEAGYCVLNQVHGLKPLDRDLFGGVQSAFAEHFPRLQALTGSLHG